MKGEATVLWTCDGCDTQLSHLAALPGLPDGWITIIVDGGWGVERHLCSDCHAAYEDRWLELVNRTFPNISGLAPAAPLDWRPR